MSTNGSFWNQNGVPPNTDPSGINARFVIINPVIGGIDAINAYDAFTEHQLNIDTLTTNLAGVTGSLAGKQPLDATLTALAAQTATAGQVSYATGTDTFGLFDTTAYGRTWANLVDAASARTNLGLVIGTNVQAYNANLAALSGLTLAADRLPYATGAGALALANFTAFGRGIVAAADNTAFLSAAGLGNAANRAIGTSGANVPLLNAGNTWASSQTFQGTTFQTGNLAVSGNTTLTGTFGMSGTSIAWNMQETDGGTNAQYWRHFVDGAAYSLQLLNDSYAGALNVFQISRTAHTAATVTFPSTTSFTANGSAQFNGTLTSTSGVEVSNASPTIRFYENDQGTDLKRSRYLTNGAVHSFQIGNDADSTYISAYDISRSTNVSATFTFPSTTTVNIDGNVNVGTSARVIGNDPLLYLHESDAGTDLKVWSHTAVGGTYGLLLLSDAYNSGAYVYTIGRSTNASATFAFPSTTGVSFSGTATFNTAPRLSNNININGRNAANSADIAIARVNTSDRVEIAGEEIIPWTAWTPTVSIVNGSVTLTVLGYARYRKQGRICFYEISAECTPDAGNTNTAGELRFTTPITPSREQAGGGGYETNAGHALYAKINQAGGYIACLRVNAGSPLRDPANANNVAPYIVLSGWYEVA